MNDWIVESPSFEEDLMNNKMVMLNQNGINKVVEIIKEKDKEIERLNYIIDKQDRDITSLTKSKLILKERHNKTIEYIENEMPCLWEVDDVWEDINGNYQHNYKEYDPQILLNKLKGDDK